MAHPDEQIFDSTPYAAHAPIRFASVSVQEFSIAT